MSTDILQEDGQLDFAAANALLDDFENESVTDYEAAQAAAAAEVTEKHGAPTGGGPPTKTEPSPKSEEQPKQSAADEKSGSDDEVADDENAGDDWTTTEDVVELIESLGLSTDDLTNFKDADELNRYATLMDKQFSTEGSELLQRLRPGDEQQQALNAQEEAAKKQAQIDRANQQARNNGQFAKEGDEADGDIEPYQVQLDEFHDEEVVKEFKNLSAHYEKRIASLEARLQQSDEQQRQNANAEMLNRFDGLVDNLGDEDLFGKTDDGPLDQNSDQWKNRAKLWESAGVIMAGMANRGKATTMSRALLKRAKAQAFPDHTSEKKRQSASEKADRANERKLRGGGTSGAKSKLQPNEAHYDGDPEVDPVLLDYWNRMANES